MSERKTMRWTAPMTWTDRAEPGKVLRIVNVPGASRNESVFVFRSTDGAVLTCSGEGVPLRSSLHMAVIDVVNGFDAAYDKALPFEAPRSPIKGMVVTPQGGDLAGILGGAVAGTVMPMVDARIEEALEGIEERVKDVIAEAGKRPIVIQIPSVPDVRIDGTEHSRFADMVRLTMAQPPKSRNVLLYGERGSGKSTAAKQFAEKMGMSYGAVSFSAGASESLFTGRFLPTEGGAFKWAPTPFTRLYTEGGVFCLDELDKADPQVATALNMALANGEIVTTEGAVLKRHAQFIAVGGANSLRFSKVYAAAQPQDGSLLDRFVKVEWNICPVLLRSVVTAICGNDKAAKILRIRENVNGVLRDKRCSDWDVGMRVAERMAYVAAADMNPVEYVLRDEVRAMVPQYEDDVMNAAGKR